MNEINFSLIKSCQTETTTWIISPLFDCNLVLIFAIDK